MATMAIKSRATALAVIPELALIAMGFVFHTTKSDYS